MNRLALLLWFSLPAVAQICQQPLCVSPASFSGTGTMTAVSGGRFSSFPASNLYVVAVSNVGSTQVAVAVNGGTPGSPLTYTPGSALTIGDGVTWTPSAGGTPVLGDSWTISTTANGSLNQQTFGPGLPGTVMRDAQARLRETASVTDFSTTGAAGGPPTVGDGVTDDTLAFNNAYSALAAAGGTLHVPAAAACYMVYNVIRASNVNLAGDGAASTCIMAFPNVVFTAGSVTVSTSTANIVGAGTGWTNSIVGDVIVVGANSQTVATFTDPTHISVSSPWAVNASGASYSAAHSDALLTTPATTAPLVNETISGLTLDGNRANQTAIVGDGNSNGILLRGGSGTVLRDLVIRNFYTDGFDLIGSGSGAATPGSNILVDNVHVSNARRNGCSIITTAGLIITHSSFAGTNGTAPQAGCDIEPNTSSQVVDHIHISHSTFTGNMGQGLQVALMTAEPNFDLTIDPDVTADSFLVNSNTNTNITGPIKIGGTFGASGGALGVDLYYTTGAHVAHAISAGSTNAGLRLDTNTTGVVVTDSSFSGGNFDLYIDSTATNNVLDCTVIYPDHTINDNTQFGASGNRYCDGAVEEMITNQAAGPTVMKRYSSGENTFYPTQADLEIIFGLHKLSGSATTFKDFAAVSGGPVNSTIDSGGHVCLVTASAGGTLTPGLCQDKNQMANVAKQYVRTTLGIGVDPVNSALLPYLSPSPVISQATGINNAGWEVVSPLSVLFATGTISVTAVGSPVVGVGTSWTSSVVGQIFQAGASSQLIATFTDATHIGLSGGWVGPTLSGSAYSITALPCYWFGASSNGTTNTDFDIFGACNGVTAGPFLFGIDGRFTVPGNLNVGGTCTGCGSGSAITALTGDGTASGPGSAAFTLATVNAATGSCGTGTAVCVPTFNNKGLATGATTAAIPLPLKGTTGSIGGSVLVAGACSSGTVSVAGSTTSMAAVASPAAGADPSNGGVLGVSIDAFILANGTVTVRVCSPIAGTPAAAAYNVRVIQ